MAAKLYSDIQENIDALASRIESASSFDGTQAANIALQLLGRKQLKIKSGALAQIFKSLDRDADTKACRDELIEAGILEKLPGSGTEGKPAVYRIVTDAVLPEGDEVEDVVPDVVEVEVESVETVEVAAGDGGADVAGVQMGQRPEEPDADAKREFVSMVGRGAAFRTRPKRDRDDRVAEKTEDTERATVPQEPDPATKAAPVAPDAVEPRPEKDDSPSDQSKEQKPRVEAKPDQKGKRRKRTHKSDAAQNSKAKTADRAESKDNRQGSKKAAKDGSSNGRDRERERAATTAHSESEGRKDKRVPMRTVARVLGGRIVKASPVTKALARVKQERKDIVKVDRGTSTSEKPRKQNDGRSMRESIDLIMAWTKQHSGAEVPFASRRQRAYEILGDEKAFDGKSGERLLKKLNEKGITPLTLKMTPSRPSHFMGFYAIGANKPFIVVENLDTYDEISRLLKGRRNVRLFGIKVGGVIFGGGCKASVSHALDEYLSDIGYGFDYVYYAGDIDREGARIIEQTRAANVIQVRMHVGMYRAMIAEHKRRLKEGSVPEAAATMQGVPQNLATTIKDLPMVARVQFRNILRDNQRVPQEILMSEAYRDASSDRFERMLNQ